MGACILCLEPTKIVIRIDAWHPVQGLQSTQSQDVGKKCRLNERPDEQYEWDGEGDEELSCEAGLCGGSYRAYQRVRRIQETATSTGCSSTKTLY